VNLQEAAAVLAKIQAYDGRTVATANVAAWAESLEEVDAAAALSAVTEHFRESTDWLMPMHIIKRINDKHFQYRQRVKEMGPPDFPTGLTHAEEADYRYRFNTYTGHGFEPRTREAAHRYADRWVWGELDESLSYERRDELDALPPAAIRAGFENWLYLRDAKQLPPASETE
jgi:hypothetical protein